MKKLFVSVPMRGRSNDNIEKSIEFMVNLARVIFGEELLVVHNLISETPPEEVNNPSVYYLGKAISKMSEVDYFIGVDPESAKLYPGCVTEDYVAIAYDIPRYFVNPKAYIYNDAFNDLLSNLDTTKCKDDEDDKNKSCGDCLYSDTLLFKQPCEDCVGYSRYVDKTWSRRCGNCVYRTCSITKEPCSDCIGHDDHPNFVSKKRRILI